MAEKMTTFLSIAECGDAWTEKDHGKQMNKLTIKVCDKLGVTKRGKTYIILATECDDGIEVDFEEAQVIEMTGHEAP